MFSVCWYGCTLKRAKHLWNIFTEKVWGAHIYLMLAVSGQSLSAQWPTEQVMNSKIHTFQKLLYFLADHVDILVDVG